MGRGNAQVNAARGSATTSGAAVKRRGGAAARNKRKPTQEQLDRMTAIEETITNLDAKIQDITPIEYRKWLQGLSRSYNYSPTNYWLVQLQKPNATRVASFKKWKEQGRTVKKGEKALFIRIPMKISFEDKDSNGVVRRDANGDPKKKTILIYKPKAAVFDISQTELLEGHTDVSPPNPTAAQCISDVAAAAEARGVQVFRGGADDPQFRFQRALNASLCTSLTLVGSSFLQAACARLVTKQTLRLLLLVRA